MERLGQVLGRIVKGYGLEGRMLEATLEARWAGLVGDALAAHTRPGRLQRRTLQVLVDSPAWLHELTFLKAELLATLVTKLGEEVVQGVEFRLDIPR